MNFIKKIAIITSIAIVTFACKKEEVDEVDLVKKKFIGKWALKVRVLDTLVNNVSNGPDTTTISVADTLNFTEDGKLTSRTYNTTYSLNATADNITYNINPPVTWHIDFVRIKSIILSRQRTEVVNGVTTVYKTQEQLFK